MSSKLAFFVIAAFWFSNLAMHGLRYAKISDELPAIAAHEEGYQLHYATHAAVSTWESLLGR